MATALDDKILAIIEEAYDFYRAGRLQREPRIGASLLVDDIRQIGGGMELLGWGSRRKQYGAVRSALARLVRAGKLETSVGVASSGRVEWQYNPTAQT